MRWWETVANNSPVARRAPPIDGDAGDNNLPGTDNDDVIRGFEGNDILSGFAGLDTLYGDIGNDLLFGGNDVDTLNGGAGDDTIQGVGSAVLLTTSGPSDVIDGGAGIDVLIVNYGRFINSGTGQPSTVTLNVSTGSGEVIVGGFRGENFSRIERLNFYGPDGADVITGGKYNDTIDGQGGNDILKAGKGDDIVRDSWGVVDADGGDGIDSIEFNRNVYGHFDVGDAVIDGNAGTITVGGVATGTFVHFENLTVFAGYGNDTIIGIVNGVNNFFADNGIFGADAGDKTFYGQNLDDQLSGGSADDILYGRGGNDRMVGYGGTNRMYGGGGNDTFTVVSVGGVDFVYAGDGNDIINVGGRGSVVDGGAGDDLLFVYEPYTASAGIEAYHGGGGHDLFRLYFQDAALDLSGTAVDGFEVLDFVDYGGAVNLTLTLTAAQFLRFDSITFSVRNGNDDSFVIALADNADVILAPIVQFDELRLADGGQRADLSAVDPDHVPVVTGSNGDDTVIGPGGFGPYFKANLGDGNDTFTGGVGRDRVFGGNGSDTLLGGGGNDVVNFADDVLFGEAGNDKLDGGTRNDVLDGGIGKDSILGGAGKDEIKGGAAADRLNGGAGFDKFVYSAAADSTGKNFDIVTGFDFNAQDRFDLKFAVTGIDTAVTAGTLSNTSFDDDLEAAIGSGQLALAHAVVFQPNAGDYAGETFLVIETNGIEGYQAKADLVIMLNNLANIPSLDAADFT